MALGIPSSQRRAREIYPGGPESSIPSKCRLTEHLSPPWVGAATFFGRRWDTGLLNDHCSQAQGPGSQAQGSSPALSLPPCTDPASRKMGHLVPALGAELPLLEDKDGGSRPLGRLLRTQSASGKDWGGAGSWGLWGVLGLRVTGGRCQGSPWSLDGWRSCQPPRREHQGRGRPRVEDSLAAHHSWVGLQMRLR